jgi:hypothetical protein
LKYFYNIFIFLCIAGYSMAQSSRYAPSALRVGADPGTLLYMVFSEKRGFFETEADIDIDRFFLVANYGMSSFRLDESTYQYENTGTYFRFGADMNLMYDDPNNNVTFFGMRYARAAFNDQLDYSTQAVIETNTGWPNTVETMTNDRLRAGWFEMDAGLKIRVVKQLYLGFTMRYKLMLKVTGQETLRPYYVPGFGKNIGTSAFGFNYYVSYRLPFRTKTIFIEDSKK